MKDMVSTKEVLKLFGISTELLRRMMRATPDDFEPKPWVNLGTVKRPVHRWQTGQVLLDWAAKTATWRHAPTPKKDRPLLLPPPAPRPEPHTRTGGGVAKRRRIVASSGALKSSSRSPLMQYAIKERDKS